MVDVVIIGGGLSGLSAAVDLAQRGLRIVLAEQGPKLGGRCYSYIDKTTGDIVDNGQHVLLGAYHHLLHYLELIGTAQFLKHEPTLRLTFHHPSKGFGTFRIVSLPRPFDLAAGIFQFTILSFRDRQRLLNVGRYLHSWNQQKEEELSSLTLKQWLVSLHQSEEAQRCVWNPIAISVMNDLPEKSSALLFARSLRAVFLGRKADSAILIPTVGQTELYVDGAVQFLKKHHVEILMNAEVHKIQTNNSIVTGVSLKDGPSLHSKAVISTVPYYSLKRLLATEQQVLLRCSEIDTFSSAPIISLHLWFDKEFMSDEYIGLIDRTIQWLFNRRKITGGDPPSIGYLSAVISAAYDYIDMPKEQLVARALDDIQNVYPESRDARLVSSVVIKEKRATFSSSTDTEKLRPTAKTAIEHFYLAGDWTQTGLPATIEGAVKSGVTAAKFAVDELR